MACSMIRSVNALTCSSVSSVWKFIFTAFGL